jgi:cobalt-zinc-cadmium efflux system membrane fusion protein
MKTLAYLFVLAATISLTFSCRNREIPVEDTAPVPAPGTVAFTQDQIKEAGLSFGTIQEKQLSHDFPARGKLVLPPGSKATVTTVTGGTLVSIQTQRGNKVAKGQALAYISDPELVILQQDYLSALAQKAYMEKEYERQAALNREEVNSAKVFQKTEAELKELQARTDGLAVRLRQAGINPSELLSSGIQEKVAVRSPVSGKVESVLADLGQYVGPETPLFEVVDTRRLLLEMAVFEKDVLSVREGQRVTFELGITGDRSFEAKVSSIGSVVSEDARVVGVLAEFVNEGQLLPGMFASAKIHAGEDLYMALPEEAVLTRSEEEQYIFYTLDDPSSASIGFHKVLVKTGFREDGWVQIECESPLPEGALVVVKGVYYVWAEMEKSAEE